MRFTKKIMQENEDLTEYVSKTKLKAEAEAQQALGKRLTELPKDKLTKLDIPEALYEAVIESHRLTANGAKRRHLQYIGKLMRDVDAAPITEQLSRWDGTHQEENAQFHLLERWRDKLIAESVLSESDTLQSVIEKYPLADIQQLRTLSRNAYREKEKNKPPKNSRALFKLLRELHESNCKNV